MNLSLYTCFHDLISWIIWDRKQYYLLCLVAKRVEEWSEKTLHLLLGNGGKEKTGGGMHCAYLSKNCLEKEHDGTLVAFCL